MNEKETGAEKKPPRRVTICTMKGFEEELKYLKKQPNQSFYVWSLIRENMKKENEDKEIIEIVRQAMQSISSTRNTNNNAKEKMDTGSLEQNKLKKSALSILQD